VFSTDTTQLIGKALHDNAFLKHLDSRQRDDLIRCMKAVNFKAGSVIMSEGEVGTAAYVIEGLSFANLKGLEINFNDAKSAA
jgi:hypothetical protein